ncbi:MAG: hypothetical protein IJ122_06360 [Methanobrevibacter sp.]|nr:hypothetical protein [Methanobrevibacter sp.]
MREAIKVELIWNSINRTRDEIRTIFYVDGKWTRKDMEDYYFRLNDIASQIVDKNEMDFQQEEA